MRLESFSANASDLFKIAVNIAGFDAKELMKEIHWRTRYSKADRVSEPTVLKAMAAVEARRNAPEPRDFWEANRRRKEERARELL